MPMNDRCHPPGGLSNDRLHSNMFIDLNGLPYILGEYFDRLSLKTIDRSEIDHGIFIDDNDAMRAVIDIRIDDIGKRSDGTPNIYGNLSKSKYFIDCINRNVSRLDGTLPVLKSGIIMRVNYQLENGRTTQVIRSMSEDFRINEREYFLDINPNNINDNGIIVNFSNSKVSTVTEFTHGRDQMQLRITNVQMFYEMVVSKPPIPGIRQSMTSHPYDNNCGCPVPPGSTADYFYHDAMQSRHFLGDPCFDRNEPILCPPNWSMFNVFYHFENDGKTITLHHQEIYDPMCKVVLVPCGNTRVNRVFIINPGHRLIFQFSVWKNDITCITNTYKVAKALRAKFYNCADHCDCNHSDEFNNHYHHHHDHHEHHHHDDHCNRSPENAQLIQMLYDERKRNDDNGKIISDLLKKIKDLEDKINNSGDDPTEPSEDPGCDCDCDHDDIYQKINQIEDKLEAEDIDPMTPETVESIFQEVKRGGN